MKRTAVILVCALVGDMAVGMLGNHVLIAQAAGRDSRSPLAGQATDRGRAPASFPLSIVVGLDLHHKADLEEFLADVSDPASPNFQHFLSQDEFNDQYGPTQEEEDSVVQWLTASGFQVTERFANRLLVSAVGDNAAAERAFGVSVHNVLFQGQAKYAVLEELSLPAHIAEFITGVVGLDNLVEVQPKLRARPTVPPNAGMGISCCHFSPNDLSIFYNDTTSYTGSGQTIVIAGAYAWNTTDQTIFNNQWVLPQLPTGSGQVCTGKGNSPGCQFSSQNLNSLEISLDVEYSHGTAPAAVIKNYMAASTSWTDFQKMYNKIVTDNPGHTVSTSWGACESGTSTSIQTTNDNIFANGNAKGQSWFAASGDYGSSDCGGGSTTPTVDHPANSPHVIGVGGTAAFCSSGMVSGNTACGGYYKETAWSGSGGGKSAIFSKPSWQTGCNVPADGARDVPDVSLASDTNQYGYFVYNGGAWYIVGGTSAAAPQWAGFFAELNQKKGGSGLGLPGVRIYQLCVTNPEVYHDITKGDNYAYSAGQGYDQTTGVGTINVNNFLTKY